jgi:uncharacterized membrane protein YvlD (DUF360 family)
MKAFLKSLVINFLAVFFANYFLPGIDVVKQTKIPHLGGDIIFAFAVGFLNALVYPVLRVIQQQMNLGKIGLGVVVVTFVSYAVAKFTALGIEILSIEGYLLAAVVVSAVGIFTGYLELKHARSKPPEGGGGIGIIS